MSVFWAVVLGSSPLWPSVFSLFSSIMAVSGKHEQIESFFKAFICPLDYMLLSHTVQFNIKVQNYTFKCRPYVTLEHKTVVKIMNFSFMPKIIMILSKDHVP